MATGLQYIKWLGRKQSFAHVGLIADDDRADAPSPPTLSLSLVSSPFFSRQDAVRRRCSDG